MLVYAAYLVLAGLLLSLVLVLVELVVVIVLEAVT